MTQVESNVVLYNSNNQTMTAVLMLAIPVITAFEYRRHIGDGRRHYYDRRSTNENSHDGASHDHILTGCLINVNQLTLTSVKVIFWKMKCT
jgi:hypothetical protein